MLAIGLAFSASILWGVADFCGGALSRRRALVVVLLGMQLGAVIPAALIVIASGDPAPSGSALAWGLAAGAAGGLGLAAFYRGLAIGTMSIVAPIGATGAVVPVIAGLADGERPAALQLAGIALAMAGVALASREPARGRSTNTRAAVVLALLAACGMGVALLGVGRASVGAGVPWALLLVRLPAIAMMAAAAAVTRPPLPRTPRAAAPLIALGLADLAGNGLFALATTEGLLSLVSVVAAIYPAFTVLLARALLGERVTAIQDVGVIATLAGVVAITAG